MVGRFTHWPTSSQSVWLNHAVSASKQHRTARTEQPNSHQPPTPSPPTASIAPGVPRLVLDTGEDGRKDLVYPQIAYHGTRWLREALRDGLIPRRPCGCICLAEKPSLAANFGTVLRVDIAGLEVVWEKGEGRIHAPIARERLRPLGYRPDPSWDGWEDPAVRRNHVACLET